MSNIALPNRNGDPQQPITSRLLTGSILKRLSYYPRAARALIYARDSLPAASPKLEIVAEYIGMSSSGFSRYFTAKIGITFSEALRTLRIERALEELERHECSIELLAARNGYSSCCTFTRAFKAVLGETPSEYRQRLLL